LRGEPPGDRRGRDRPLCRDRHRARGAADPRLLGPFASKGCVAVTGPLGRAKEKPPEGGFDHGTGGSGLPVLHFFWRYLRSAAICAAITASSDCAIAMSMSLLALRSASSAAALAAVAFSSSRSLPRIAVSDSTVTVVGWTSRMPP